MSKTILRIYKNNNISNTLFLFLIFSFLVIVLGNFFKIFASVSIKAIILLLGFIVTFSVYFFTRIEKSISSVIRDIITGKTAGLYGLSGILIILSMISWFGDAVFNLINNQDKEFSTEELLKPFFILISIFIFGFTYLILYPTSHTDENQSDRPLKKKVLVMALSVLTDEKLYQELESFITEKGKNFEDELQKICKANNNSSLCKINWLLPLRVLMYHRDKLERAYFVVSKESNNQWEKFFKLVEKIDEVCGSKLADTIKPTKVVNMDDHKDIMDELKKTIREIKRNGYKDEDISVNISGGTSAVSMCLTLFALEDKRQIEYFTQIEKPAVHKRFNLSKDDAIAFLESHSL